MRCCHFRPQTAYDFTHTHKLFLPETDTLLHPLRRSEGAVFTHAQKHARTHAHTANKYSVWFFGVDLFIGNYEVRLL